MAKKHLGELLIEEGYITQKMLDKALELQKENNILLGEALLTLDALTRPELEKFLFQYRDIEEVRQWAESILKQEAIDNIVNNNINDQNQS